MTAPASPTASPLAALLAEGALAPRQAYKALSLWPLVRPEDAPAPRGPGFVLLADAVAAGDALVDEVSEHGSVPHVRVANHGTEAVLVMFGEALRGAKQNRVANASFLVAPGSVVDIDVSCVEQGRWQRRAGARFAADAHVVSSALRHKMERKVRESRARGAGYDADQAEVWREVEERILYSRAESHTGAYDDYVATRHHDVETVCGAFAAVPGQVGFVAALGDAVVGAELMGRPAPFAHAFIGLLRGYAIDAVDAAFLAQREGAPARGPRFDAPEPFLAALAAAPAEARPSLGLGEDLRLAAPGLVGCALVAGGGLVHATAFAEGSA
jgi:hypothetical protein